MYLRGRDIWNLFAVFWIWPALFGNPFALSEIDLHYSEIHLQYLNLICTVLKFICSIWNWTALFWNWSWNGVDAISYGIQFVDLHLTDIETKLYLFPSLILFSLLNHFRAKSSFHNQSRIVAIRDQRQRSAMSWKVDVRTNIRSVLFIRLARLLLNSYSRMQDYQSLHSYGQVNLIRDFSTKT